jgi:hypothetical protein
MHHDTWRRHVIDALTAVLPELNAAKLGRIAAIAFDVEAEVRAAVEQQPKKRITRSRHSLGSVVPLPPGRPA